MGLHITLKKKKKKKKKTFLEQISNYNVSGKSLYKEVT
jgi:hypothetical protein